MTKFFITTIFLLVSISCKLSAPSIPFSLEIVLVNIGHLDRAGVAQQLEILAKYNPKVVGIDAFFKNPKRSSDPIQDSILIAGDSALSRAIRKFENFILGAELVEKDNIVQDVNLSHKMFHHKNVSFAILDFLASSGSSKLISEYLVYTKISDSLSKAKKLPFVLLSMGAQLALQYDKKSLNAYLNNLNGKNIDKMDFYGNIGLPNKLGHNYHTSYVAIDTDQLLNEEFDPDLFKGKIVLLGYLGENFMTYTSEDKFYFYNEDTKRREEIFGMIIHANACAKIIKK